MWMVSKFLTIQSSGLEISTFSTGQRCFQPKKLEFSRSLWTNKLKSMKINNLKGKCPPLNQIKYYWYQTLCYQFKFNKVQNSVDSLVNQNYYTYICVEPLMFIQWHKIGAWKMKIRDKHKLIIFVVTITTLESKFLTNVMISDVVTTVFWTV